MRRRIIKQGHNTLTVTLPSKWVQLFNLKQGDEIEINERENGLFLTTEKHDEELKVEIDLAGLDIPTIWKYIMAVYREGYDEITIKFDPNIKYEHPLRFFSLDAYALKKGKLAEHTPYEILRIMTSRFIGFEIIEHHKNYCVIKNMAQLTSKEFDPSLRRVFLLLQQMAEETNEAIQNNDPKVVAHLRDIDLNLDKFVDYCIRVLNKTGFKDVKKSHVLFSILYLLELLGDEYKNMSMHISKDMHGKNLKNLKDIVEAITKQVDELYHLYYDFNRERLSVISNAYLDVRIYKASKAKMHGEYKWTKEEAEVINHLSRIGRYVKALTELRIEMEF